MAAVLALPVERLKLVETISDSIAEIPDALELTEEVLSRAVINKGGRCHAPSSSKVTPSAAVDTDCRRSILRGSNFGA
jgi:hypothetical protein